MNFYRYGDRTECLVQTVGFGLSDIKFLCLLIHIILQNWFAQQIITYIQGCFKKPIIWSSSPKLT